MDDLLFHAGSSTDYGHLAALSCSEDLNSTRSRGALEPEVSA